MHVHIVSKNPLPKTGLLIGVILGSALVTQVGNILNHVTIKDVLQVDNSAAVIQSMIKDERLARQTQLIPEPGSTVGSTEIISWEPIGSATGYTLSVGTYKGGLDIAHIAVGNETMAVVDGIPQDGRTVYVRLSYTLNGSENFFDATYTADIMVAGEEDVDVVGANPFNPTHQKSVK